MSRSGVAEEPSLMLSIPSRESVPVLNLASSYALPWRSTCSRSSTEGDPCVKTFVSVHDRRDVPSADDTPGLDVPSPYIFPNEHGIQHSDKLSAQPSKEIKVFFKGWAHVRCHRLSFLQ